MALIVEDGTGLPNAEAYSSVVDADAYFAARNAVAWATLTTGAKEAALRRGAEFLVEQYETQFLGTRFNSEQGLSFPRGNVPAPYGPDDTFLDPSIIPQAVIRASLEVALIYTTSDPYSSGKIGTINGYITKERTKIGPIEKEKTYSVSEGSSLTLSNQLPTLDEDRITSMLRPYLTSVGMRFVTERA